MNLRVEPLGADEARRWDELVAPYATRQLFHRQVWLDYLAATQDLEIRKWSIEEGSRRLGYFCGGIVRKGPFRILGSPLRGWGTNFMGPVVDEPIDQLVLLGALDEVARQERLAIIEMESPLLQPAALSACSYEEEHRRTLLVSLSPLDPDAAFERIPSKKRNQIRKAIKSGLTVEDTDDPAVADEYYDRFQDLMRRKGLVPPYPREHPRALFRHLKPAGLLFSLRVRDASGRVLAIGLFTHDERTVYFWGGASGQDGRELNPNDYLQWSVIRLACERGLQVYNMSGPGHFKAAFGGELVDVHRWHKCHWRSARWARRGYEAYFNAGLRLKAQVRRLSVLSPGRA
jgi:CelD/BcsL family acetyltransferase involved in cellulose biosynthesis